LQTFNYDRAEYTSQIKMLGYFRTFLIILLYILIVSIIVLSLVPPVSKDALTHHLAIPKLYLKHGGIYEIPSLEFSYYPMNLDLLYLIPLYFGNDIIPKFIHFSFALLTAWLIFDYLRSRINTLFGLLGIIFFLSVPIVVKLSITVYVDLGLIFFSTASLLLLLRWLEGGFQLKFLIKSAVFCGLAMGTKYNGLISFFLLTLFVPFIHSKCARGKKFGFSETATQGLIFLFIALLVFSPWMIRNYIWTNNPIFPLFNHWFNSKSASNHVEIDIFTFRHHLYHESWWQMALLPLRIFFEGQDGNPQHFDGKLNPFLFILPFFAFYRIKHDPHVIRIEKKIMLSFAVLYFCFAFFSEILRIRYISPIIPPLIILSVFGIRNIFEIISKIRHCIYKKIGMGAIYLAFLFALWLNGVYILDQFRYVDPISYINGSVGRDEYIQRYRPEYHAINYANKNLSDNAKILCLFLGNRSYYSDREMLFDINLFQKIIKGVNTPEMIFDDFKIRDITHLLVRFDLFTKWSNTSFDNSEKKMLEKFFQKYLSLLFSKDGYGLFRMEDNTAAEMN